MATLHTTDDLLRAARENKEFREAFRRELLTDALIAVPDQLEELAVVTANLAATGEVLLQQAKEANSRMDGIDNRVAELVKGITELSNNSKEANSRMDGIDNRVAELVKGIAELSNNSKEANSRMDGIDNRVAELVKGIAELSNNSKEANSRMDGIDNRVAELVKGIADYKTASENHLGSIDRDIKSLHQMYSQQHDDYERFRGSYAENSARKDDGVIASRIARARGNRVLITERLSREDLTAIFKEAVERNLLDGIGEESQERFANADDTLLVTERGRASTQFYIVIEASHTAHQSDLSRVANHAKVIERVKGVPAYGVVAGIRIGRNMPNDLLLHDPVTFVQEKDPDTAFWHQIRREVMDPMTEPQ